MSEKSGDLQLLKRFNNGDISAFEDLVLRYQDRIYSLCRHMLGSAHDAEDAAQDTFLKAYQKLKDFKPEASLYTWLYLAKISYYCPVAWNDRALLSPLQRRREADA